MNDCEVIDATENEEIEEILDYPLSTSLDEQRRAFLIEHVASADIDGKVMVTNLALLGGVAQRRQSAGTSEAQAEGSGARGTMNLLILYGLAFGSSFVFIFLKAFQQLNVVRGAYVWVVPTSLSMAACEVYVVATVARQGWGWIIFPIGIGAGLGAMTAMWTHKHFVRQR